MAEKKELEIDTGKLFSLFKRKPKKKGSSEFEWGRLAFLRKPWVLTTVLVLIPFILAFSLRMTPASLPLADEWATQAVHNNIQSTLAQDINSQNPNLPDLQKQELLSERFKQVLSEQKADVAASVQKTSEYFKSQMQDDENYTYLLGIDEYAYYRYAQNVLNTGQEYDTLKNGTPWDTHMVAPLGTKLGVNLYPHLIAINHRVLSFFGIKNLMGSIFFVPIILSALAVIPAFFLGRRFAGNIGGFVAATITGVSAPFISRTAGGVADTDAFNVVFPLIIAWLFIEAMERESFRSKLGFASLAGLLVGVYSLVWKSWWFIFDLLLVVIIGFFGFHILKALLSKQKKLEGHVKRNLWSSLSFIVASGVFVGAFKGISEFFTAPFIDPINVYYYKAVAKFSLWPNVMTTVAEQNAMSVASVISTMGGALMVFAAVLGLLFIAFDFKKLTKKEVYCLAGGGLWLFMVILFFPVKSALMFDILVALPFIASYALLLGKKEKLSIEFSLLGIAWFLLTFFASVRGVRFTLLLVPVFALGFGVFVGTLFSVLQTALKKGLGIEEWISRAILTVGVILLLISPTIAGARVSYSEVPIINDAWFGVLTKIKTNATPDAIINSWWDYGHWFKAIADRAVTFDGASQNTPMAHWIGLSLLTSHENLTVGILRMLDCGSNTAFEVLDKEVNDTPKSVQLLYKVVATGKIGADEILKANGVSEKTRAEVLKFTHCTPPENYYIASDDMIGKSGVWAHFGSWNFTKASMYMDVTRLGKDKAIEILQSQYRLTNDDAMRVYYEIQSTPANDWIAPWPSYASQPTTCSKQGNKLQCVHSIGRQVLPFEINLTTMEAYIKAQDGMVYPNNFVYPTEGGYMEKKYSGRMVGIGLNLISANGKYTSVLMDPKLSLSTFNKLYYYGAHGLKCFKLFDEKTQFTGGKVFVYKVDWNCTQ